MVDCAALGNVVTNGHRNGALEMFMPTRYTVFVQACRFPSPTLLCCYVHFSGQFHSHLAAASRSTGCVSRPCRETLQLYKTVTNHDCASGTRLAQRSIGIYPALWRHSCIKRTLLISRVAFRPIYPRMFITIVG